MPASPIRLQIAGGGEVALQPVVAAVAFRQRLQTGIFHGQFTELLRAAGDLVAGEQPADLLKAIGQFLERWRMDSFMCLCGRAFSGMSCTL